MLGRDSRTPQVPRHLALLALLLTACAERNEADDLRQQLLDDDYRTTYARAPGWPDPRQPSPGGPHGDFVDIYVNDVIEDALAAGEPLDAWPEGSSVVKDGWDSASGGELKYLAFMERRDEGWFWAEYRGNGRVVAAGLDDRRCAECHAAGADSVHAFDLPR
jgi:hypothetical protein